MDLKTSVKVVYTEHVAIANVSSKETVGNLKYSEDIRIIRERLLEEAGISQMLCSITPIISPLVPENITVAQWERLARGNNVITFSPFTSTDPDSLTAKARDRETFASENLELTEKMKELSKKGSKGNQKKVYKDQLQSIKAEIIDMKAILSNQNITIEKLKVENEERNKVNEEQNAKIFELNIANKEQNAKISKISEKISKQNVKIEFLYKEMYAHKTIHQLVNFISLFRSKILEEINKTRNHDPFSNWMDMRKEINQSVIDACVNDFGLTNESWKKCCSISHEINEMKYSTIKYGEGSDLIKQLEGTLYNDYVECFKELVELVELHSWVS